MDYTVNINSFSHGSDTELNALIFCEMGTHKETETQSD